VGDLETLKAVTALSLTTDDIKDLVNELSTLGVMALGPVVASTRLSEDEVVWAEKLAEWTSTNGIHGSWLQIDKDGTWNVLVAGCLVEVNVHSLKLEIGGAIVDTGAIEAVLAGNRLPEGSTDLVTALAGLKMNLLSRKTS
jgi:hypothetical protein